MSADPYAMLLARYPTLTQLTQAVRLGLGANLAEISLAGDLRAVVFDLVQWATAEGRTADLDSLPAVPATAPNGGVQFHGSATVRGPVIGGNVGTLIIGEGRDYDH